MTTETMSLEDKVRYLSRMTDRDEAGRHFTQRYSDATLTALEAEGLIAIDRPVHQPTGISYSEEHWTVEVTEDGVALVEANPEYWDVEG